MEPTSHDQRYYDDLKLEKDMEMKKSAFVMYFFCFFTFVLIEKCSCKIFQNFNSDKNQS